MKAAEKNLDIATNFRSNLVARSKVPIATPGRIPRLGELYWLDSLWSTRSQVRSWALTRHMGSGPVDTTIAKITIPRQHKPPLLRVLGTLRSFNEACTNREVMILRAKVCDDPTKFGIAIACDMEVAAVAGQVLARLLNAGKL